MALRGGTITEGTVKDYLSRLFSKVGVSDRLELALMGFRHSGNDSADRASADEIRIGDGFAPLDAVYIHRNVPHPCPN
jgi:hypothetical protein